MSPINTITEPSFTNTSKGLMTLFCIGLFHLIIGVDLTSTEIAIPWLPSVNFPNTDRLPILFWILVFFTMYRYCLHNLSTYRYYRFLAFKEFFCRSPIGLSFIKTRIFNNNKIIETSVFGESEDSKQKAINIDCLAEDGQKQIRFASLNFLFNADYTYDLIEFRENDYHEYGNFKLQQEKERKKWGLIHAERDESGEVIRFYGKKLKGFWLGTLFGTLVMGQFLYLMLKDKDMFDNLMPILLNLGLFYCWANS